MYHTRHRLVAVLAFLLVATGCRKDVRAQSVASPDAPSSQPASRGLSWILDKYRNDNLHVLVAAHRGNWDGEPENSLSAIQQGIAHGVEILELDVRLTADEQLVLMHDKTLGRTATGSGEIKYLPLSYLKEQRLIGRDGQLTDQRIPTLEEALLATKGKVLIMLDKSEYLLPWIEKVLQKTGTAQQVVLLEFNPYKQTVATYGDLLRDVLYVPGVHQSNGDIDGYIRSFEESPYNPSCFAFWIKKESSPVLPYIERVQEAGDRIWINTVDADQCAGHTDSLSLQQPDAGWGWALAKGANVLLTDRPRELIAYLQSIHRRN